MVKFSVFMNRHVFVMLVSVSLPFSSVAFSFFGQYVIVLIVLNMSIELENTGRIPRS